jgi:hypothetical protein
MDGSDSWGHEPGKGVEREKREGLRDKRGERGKELGRGYIEVE